MMQNGLLTAEKAPMQGGQRHRPGPPPGRIWALDLARTAAILGMALYHFTYDLALFGFIDPHLPFSFGWILEARIVATSFLGLAGASLVLAHGRGIRWRHFLRRFGWLAAAAAAISLSTWFDDPERYVFFGILHCIAAASLIGLLCLRLPAVLTLAAAVGVLAVWLYLPRVGFDANVLLGLGLSREVPRSMDFVPLVPWLAPYLAGMGIAQLLRGRAGGVAGGATDAAAVPAPASAPQRRLQRAMAWPGRHSLVIYVLHQPILLGLTWAAAQLLR